MPHYRATIRFGAPRQTYHVMDLTANSLREAMRMASEDFPEAASQDADLVEIRLRESNGGEPNSGEPERRET